MAAVIQGHPRSSTLVPIESLYATSYYQAYSHLTLVASRTVFEILMHKARKQLVFPTLPLFDAPAGGGSYNFWMKLIPQQLEGWGYCMVKMTHTHLAFLNIFIGFLLNNAYTSSLPHLPIGPNTLCSTQPAYLHSLLNYHNPTRSLRSANTNLLSVPRVRIAFASRGFSVAAPTVWNSLPSGIRDSSSTHTFRRLLKTHCFQQAFGSPQRLTQVPQIRPQAHTVHSKHFIHYLLTY